VIPIRPDPCDWRLSAATANRANAFLTRVPFDLNGPLRIAILLGPTVRVAALILAMKYNKCALWLNLRPWDRSTPPAPRTLHGGGARLTQKICGDPIFHFNRQTIVATALRCAAFQAAAN
jgi:hypothetical protein